ncbi:Methionine--tRNA ligase, cytoplasmic [Frankliniella fusca]|uniref:Methionine--tRNA ligase, cytoplasmic n=1 Tax=Frankliniella fusca TaxID=407009 RepID=A0AAE1HUW7_9NEOP|nr:Methionine--tRNA ligase, cytoplasmic [Frankliniella fusca]
MKILTNEKNPAVLKLLVSANVAKIKVPCETVSFGDRKPCVAHSLPILELDSGVVLSSVNQAARVILPPSSSIEGEVDQWLEWETAQLQPAVIYCICNPGKKNERLQALLNALDLTIGKSETLVKGGISVADICVWSTLYSVAADAKLCSEWIDKCQNVKAWWSKLERNSSFQTEVQKSGALAGCPGVQILSSSSWNSIVSQQGTSFVITPPIEASTTDVTGKKQKSKSQGGKSVSPPENGLEQLNISGGPVMIGPEWEKELKTAKLSWVGGSKGKPKTWSKPVLPISGERNVLVTSALPYVNNVPHLGNIIGCVLSADVFARYCRLRNYNTLYISGTDEYGTATETKALEEGLTPQEICDKYNAIHNDIYKWFNIDFDLFGRTTIPEQTELTQQLFLRLHKLGYMHTEPMEQLLCQKCDRFLADRFVEGTCPKCSFDDARGDQCDSCGSLMNATELLKPRCKLCGDTPVIRNSDQFFLDLPKIEPKLSAWFEKSSAGWTHNARVITKSWMKDGLRPRCISRDLKWGIPLPLDGYRNKVFYVWFDAPIGYMSMTKRYTQKWKEWWQPKKDVKVDYYQFMAKDNVPFHSIMFPSTLLAADEGYTVATNIMATEYLNYEDGKFSKSRGTGVFGNNAQDTGIPADYWRFYLLFVRPESQDSSFSWDDLALRINTELLNNLGNFKTFNSQIPEMTLENDDFVLLALVNREIKSYLRMLENAKLRDGLRHILSISRHGNQYIQSQQPWVKAKGSPEERKRAGTNVGLAANIACLLSVLIQPYMPQISKVMQEQMNCPVSVNLITETANMLLPAGHRIGKPSPLFTKIEPTMAEEMKKRFAGKQKSPPPQSTGKKAGAVGSVASTENVVQLEAAVEKQANLVREMKSSGKPKTEWQPEVATLLKLKADLAAAQKAAQDQTQPTTATAAGSSETVQVLQAAVDKQANLVREMKGAKKPKSEWEPHVAILLQMKADLAAAQKAMTTGSVTSSLPAPAAPEAEPACPNVTSIAVLEEAIKQQGDLVRQMKGSGKSKEEWQPEVNKLLELKQQLSALQPSPSQSSGGSAESKPSQSAGSGKSKNKKKK